jgi:hypothetical protein
MFIGQKNALVPLHTNGHSRNDNAVAPICRHGHLKRKWLQPSASTMGFKGRIQSQRNVFALLGGCVTEVGTYLPMFLNTSTEAWNLPQLMSCSLICLIYIYIKFPKSISFVLRVRFVVLILYWRTGVSLETWHIHCNSTWSLSLSS